MQRVLIDDFEADFGLDHEVAVVDLEGTAARGGGRWIVGRGGWMRVGRCAAVEWLERRHVDAVQAERFVAGARFEHGGGGGIARGLSQLFLGPMDELAHRLGVLDRVALAARRPIRGRLAAGGEVGGEELGPQRAEQLAVESAAILEADFLLGRMDVHVDHFGRHVETQEADRLPAGEQQAAIGFAEARAAASGRGLRGR